MVLSSSKQLNPGPSAKLSDATLPTWLVGPIPQKNLVCRAPAAPVCRASAQGLLAILPRQTTPASAGQQTLFGPHDSKAGTKQAPVIHKFAFNGTPAQQKVLDAAFGQLKVNPTNINAYLIIAKLYAKQSDQTAGQYYYQQAFNGIVATKQKPDTLVGIAKGLCATGDHYTATRVYQYLLSKPQQVKDIETDGLSSFRWRKRRFLSTNRHEAFINIDTTLSPEKRIQYARAMFEQARVSKDVIGEYEALGILKDLKAIKPEELSHLHQLSGMDGGDPKKADVQTVIDAAWNYVKAGHFHRAKQTYHYILSLGWAQGQPLNNDARLLTLEKAVRAPGQYAKDLVDKRIAELTKKMANCSRKELRPLLKEAAVLRGTLAIANKVPSGDFSFGDASRIARIAKAQILLGALAQDKLLFKLGLDTGVTLDGMAQYDRRAKIAKTAYLNLFPKSMRPFITWGNLPVIASKYTDKTKGWRAYFPRPEIVNNSVALKAFNSLDKGNRSQLASDLTSLVQTTPNASARFHNLAQLKDFFSTYKVKVDKVDWTGVQTYFTKVSTINGHTDAAKKQARIKESVTNLRQLDGVINRLNSAKASDQELDGLIKALKAMPGAKTVNGQSKLDTAKSLARAVYNNYHSQLEKDLNSAIAEVAKLPGVSGQALKDEAKGILRSFGSDKTAALKKLFAKIEVERIRGTCTALIQQFKAARKADKRIDTGDYPIIRQLLWVCEKVTGDKYKHTDLFFGRMIKDLQQIKSDLKDPKKLASARENFTGLMQGSHLQFVMSDAKSTLQNDKYFSLGSNIALIVLGGFLAAPVGVLAQARTITLLARTAMTVNQAKWFGAGASLLANAAVFTQVEAGVGDGNWFGYNTRTGKWNFAQLGSRMAHNTAMFGFMHGAFAIYSKSLSAIGVEVTKLGWAKYAAYKGGAFATEVIGFSAFEGLGLAYEKISKNGLKLDALAAFGSAFGFKAMLDRAAFIFFLKVGNFLASPLAKAVQSKTIEFANARYAKEFAAIKTELELSTKDMHSMMKGRDPAAALKVVARYEKALKHFEKYLDLSGQKDSPEARDLKTYLEGSGQLKTQLQTHQKIFGEKSVAQVKTSQDGFSYKASAQSKLLAVLKSLPGAKLEVGKKGRIVVRTQGGKVWVFHPNGKKQISKPSRVRADTDVTVLAKAKSNKGTQLESKPSVDPVFTKISDLHMLGIKSKDPLVTEVISPNRNHNLDYAKSFRSSVLAGKFGTNAHVNPATATHIWVVVPSKAAAKKVLKKVTGSETGQLPERFKLITQKEYDANRLVTNAIYDAMYSSHTHKLTGKPCSETSRAMISNFANRYEAWLAGKTDRIPKASKLIADHPVVRALQQLKRSTPAARPKQIREAIVAASLIFGSLGLSYLFGNPMLAMGAVAGIGHFAGGGGRKGSRGSKGAAPSGNLAYKSLVLAPRVSRYTVGDAEISLQGGVWQVRLSDAAVKRGVKSVSLYDGTQWIEVKSKARTLRDGESLYDATSDVAVRIKLPASPAIRVGDVQHVTYQGKPVYFEINSASYPVKIRVQADFMGGVRADVTRLISEQLGGKVIDVTFSDPAIAGYKGRVIHERREIHFEVKAVTATEITVQVDRSFTGGSKADLTKTLHTLMGGRRAINLVEGATSEVKLIPRQKSPTYRVGRDLGYVEYKGQKTFVIIDSIGTNATVKVRIQGYFDAHGQAAIKAALKKKYGIAEVIFLQPKVEIIPVMQGIAGRVSFEGQKSATIIVSRTVRQNNSLAVDVKIRGNFENANAVRLAVTDAFKQKGYTVRDIKVEAPAAPLSASVTPATPAKAKQPSIDTSTVPHVSIPKLESSSTNAPKGYAFSAGGTVVYQGINARVYVTQTKSQTDVSLVVDKGTFSSQAAREQWKQAVSKAIAEKLKNPTRLHIKLSLVSENGHVVKGGRYSYGNKATGTIGR